MAIFQFSKTSPAAPSKPNVGKSTAKPGSGSLAVKQKPLVDQQLNSLAAQTAGIKLGGNLPLGQADRNTAIQKALETFKEQPKQESQSEQTVGGFAAGTGVNPVGSQQTANQPVNPTVTAPPATTGSATSTTTTVSGAPPPGVNTGRQTAPEGFDDPSKGTKASQQQIDLGAGIAATGGPPPNPNAVSEDVSGGGMADLNELARQAALKQMQTNEEQNAQRRQESLDTFKQGEQQALNRAQEISDVGAMGLTGAGQMMQSDVGRIGRRETTLAMDEFDRAQRQAEADRLAGGIGQARDVQTAEFEQEAFRQAQAALPEGPNIVQNADGTMTETLDNGTVVTYDAAGREISRQRPTPEEGGSITLRRTEPGNSDNFTKDFEYHAEPPSDPNAYKTATYYDEDGNVYEIWSNGWAVPYGQ